METSLEQIDGLWRAYKAPKRLPDQLVLIKQFDERYAGLLHDGIEPALALARQGNILELDALFAKRMPPLFQAVFDADRSLVARQVQIGRDAYQDTVAEPALAADRSGPFWAAPASSPFLPSAGRFIAA